MPTDKNGDYVSRNVFAKDHLTTSGDGEGPFVSLDVFNKQVKANAAFKAAAKKALEDIAEKFESQADVAHNNYNYSGEKSLSDMAVGARCCLISLSKLP